MDKKSDRLSVTLREVDRDRLERLSERTGRSKNEVVRAALSTYAFIQKTVEEDRKILVAGEDGQTHVVEFVD